MQMANKRQKKAKPNDRLNYGDVSRELKAGGPARLYLLYGQEDYLREAFLGEIKAAWPPGRGRRLQLPPARRQEHVPARALGRRERAAVSLRAHPDRGARLRLRPLPRRRGRRAGKAHLRRPRLVHAGFVQDTDFEPDQRTKIMKAVAKYGKVINFTSQGQGPLVQWIRKRFAALGKNACPTPA